MKDKVFIDTNLWVYLYSDSPKSNVIKKIVDKHFDNIVISVQVLGELFNVFTKKLDNPKEEAKNIILDLSENFEIKNIEKNTVLEAINISLKYKYSYWDSLIIASALHADCIILYTEDLHANQFIENKLKIVNPFKEE